MLFDSSAVSSFFVWRSVLCFWGHSIPTGHEYIIAIMHIATLLMELECDPEYTHAWSKMILLDLESEFYERVVRVWSIDPVANNVDSSSPNLSVDSRWMGLLRAIIRHRVLYYINDWGEWRAGDHGVGIHWSWVIDSFSWWMVVGGPERGHRSTVINFERSSICSSGAVVGGAWGQRIEASNNWKLTIAQIRIL